MGCISSKLMPRSMSLKEELSQRMQDTLVYTANTIAPKGSDKNPKPESLADYNTLMINFNTWEFLSNVEQGGDTSTSIPTPPISKRSRSFHCYTEHDNLQELNHRSVGRARSFHTVEEFDAMMLQKTSVSDVKLQLKDDTLVQETPSSSCSQEPKELKAEREEGNNLEKVSKRKMVAKGLDPLEIPHTIEFSTVASLRGWIHSGGAANHVTPKFGSYTLPTANGCNDSVVFNPELVAAFDEHMQQIEAEAESILQQISEADRDKD